MHSTRGFTYIGLLILVAIISIALTGTAQVLSTEQRREREQELLFVGTQYARAIASYRSASPGNEAYPTKLEDLLEDKRFPVTRRHLRRLYPDPITRDNNWALLPAPNNGIAGVHSRSEETPLKQAGFPKEFQDFNNSQTYAQWRFVAGVQGVAGGGSGVQPGGLGTQQLMQPQQPATQKPFFAPPQDE